MAGRSTKLIPKANRVALARNLKAYIDANYGGVQRAAERGMKISQSHLSSMLDPERHRGIGLEVLLRLREVMRVSLDELLGLPTIDKPVPQERIEAQVRVALVEIVKEMRSAAELSTSDDLPALPPAKPGRRL